MTQWGATLVMKLAGETKWESNEGGTKMGGSEKTRCERTADSFRIGAGL